MAISWKIIALYHDKETGHVSDPVDIMHGFKTQKDGHDYLREMTGKPGSKLQGNYLTGFFVQVNENTTRDYEVIRDRDAN